MTRVRLLLGPTPAGPVRAWLAYAAAVVEEIRKSDALPFAVPTEVTDAFEEYLDSWRQAAETDPFEWAGTAESFVVRHLLTYWLNIARYFADEAAVKGPRMPEESLPFYEDLVERLLASLVEADSAAEALSQVWPRCE